MAFSNTGGKGSSDPRVVTSEEFATLPKDDLTSFMTTRDEPFNEYIVAGHPALLIRTKTVMLKVEHFKNRFTVFGDPYLWVTHDTSHSVSEYTVGELLSP